LTCQNWLLTLIKT